jgi:LacI family transcriptional regulator, galactose operon repressor
MIGAVAERATIYDVAAEAGVSISTVSLALNDPSRVGVRTLHKVMRAVDALGFVPKAEAVTRARRGVRRIGVIGPFTSYPSFSRRLAGILNRAGEERYEVVVYDQDSAATSRLVSLPVAGRIDGLIVLSVPVADDVAARLLEQQIPTVLLELTRPGFSSITIDDLAGGRLAGQLLARGGHLRYGFLGAVQTIDYLSQSRLRLAGFSEALADPPEVRLVPEDFRSAYRGARELFDGGVTAVFAHHDLLAAAALRAAHDGDLLVPGDVEIVGFDDSDIAEPLGLTTVRQPLEESGELAANLLIAEIERPSRSARNITLEVALVERETTVAVDEAPRDRARAVSR